MIAGNPATNPFLDLATPNNGAAPSSSAIAPPLSKSFMKRGGGCRKREGEAGAAEAPIVSPIPIDDRSVTGLNLNTKRNLSVC